MSRQIAQVLLEVNPQFTSSTILVYPVGDIGFGTNTKNISIFLVDENSNRKIEIDVDDTEDVSGIKYLSLEYSDLEYFYTEDSKLYLSGEFTSNSIQNPTEFTDKFFKSDYFPAPTGGLVNFKVHPFKKIHNKLPIGNLLYKRIRMGFPKWSSVEINDWSSALKLLEPLFSPLYSYFNKNITLNNSQRLGIPLQRNHVIQGSREDIGFILFSKGNDSYTLYEGDSSIHPKYYDIEPENEFKAKLANIFIDRLTDISSVNMADFYNTILYVKCTLEDDAGFLTIKGYSANNEYVQERIKVISHNYIQSSKKFAKIVEMSATTSMSLSNYVDCRTNHYIMKNTETYPPVVNKKLEFFDPHFKLGYNMKNTLDIYESNPKYSELVDQFNLESDLTVNSLYLDEHLRAYWTDGSYMHSGILSKDLTKITGMHPSTNNNKIISVSNPSTVIGDTVTIHINTDEWNTANGMIVQVKNESTILYYDHNTKNFVESMVPYYPSYSDGIIEFELEVTNDKPYIFTVRDQMFKNTYVATTIAEELKSILTTEATGTLIAFNGSITLCTAIQNDNLVKTVDNKSKNLLINISTLDKSRIHDWSISWQGRFIDSYTNTFSNISLIHNTDTSVSIVINREDILKDSASGIVDLELNITADTTVYTSFTSLDFKSESENKNLIIDIRQDTVSVRNAIQL